jgi:hypothetical protein
LNDKPLPVEEAHAAHEFKDDGVAEDATPSWKGNGDVGIS